MTKLDRCWKNQLRLSKWMAENWKKGMFIFDLKEEWLKKHGFTKKRRSNCFFCEYATSRGDERDGTPSGCPHCPANMVNRRFHCQNKTYAYCDSPKAFYAKLLALDKKRRTK